MKFEFTKSEYNKYVDKKSPKSRIERNFVRSFVIGGLICVIGQVINNFILSMGIDPQEASGATSIVLVFLGALFTALNIYDDLGRFAGAGSIVPITGFANSIVSPAMEFKSEGYITGVGSKMFIIAGPVLVFGITASIAAGILHYILTF